MARRERFTFLCDESERKLVKKLAKQLKRSESDAVRFLIREPTCEMGLRTRVDSDRQLSERSMRRSYELKKSGSIPSQDMSQRKFIRKRFSATKTKVSPH
jgi:hypothetical protein